MGCDEAGKRHYHNETFLGPKKLAEKKLRALLEKRDKNALRIRPDDSVGEWLDEWLELVAPTVRPQTLDDYRVVLNRYVRPHLAHVPLKHITPRLVRGMLTTLRKEHDLGPRTCRKAVEVFRNCLECAYEDERISDNPARSRLVRRALAKYEKVERTTITPEHVPAFLKACEQDQRLGTFWVVLLLGGLRPSEALALRWSDVRDDTLRVHRMLVDRDGMPLTFADTKSRESRRDVVVPSAALAFLKRHRKQQAVEQLRAGEAWQDNNLVFCNEVGEPMRQDWTRGPFRRPAQSGEAPGDADL